MDRKKRRAIFQKGAEVMERLDLEPAIVADVPRMELTGNRVFYLDKHKGVLSYSSENIDIGGGSIVIRLHGKGLEIVAMTDDELRITGKIEKMELME